MVDIVLDTYVAKKLLKNEDYIKKVIEICNHIYVPYCWRREMKQFPIQLISELRRKYKKLHEVRIKATLPKNIEKIFSGDECDREYVALALERMKHQPTILVSDDKHILDLAGVSSLNIQVLDLESECRRVLEEL